MKYDLSLSVETLEKKKLRKRDKAVQSWLHLSDKALKKQKEYNEALHTWFSHADWHKMNIKHNKQKPVVTVAGPPNKGKVYQDSIFRKVGSPEVSTKLRSGIVDRLKTSPIGSDRHLLIHDPTLLSQKSMTKNLNIVNMTHDIESNTNANNIWWPAGKKRESFKWKIGGGQHSNKSSSKRSHTVAKEIIPPMFVSRKTNV
ncbi:hypothetical protein AKO1_004954 [Acrasis kona]|uniref:Uncharacterized protein n=1 Tax=Acrasis kona TaxID=1008807 RepID=A0AAW2YVB2_9EUKA